MSASGPRFIHENVFDGIRYTWDVRLLWVLAAEIPVIEVDIATIAAVDEDCWFHTGQPSTTRNVVRHVRRILAADFGHPIILNVDGSVMDGLHRVARALLEGRPTVPAVRFTTMPPAQKSVAVDSNSV